MAATTGPDAPTPTRRAASPGGGVARREVLRLAGVVTGAAALGGLAGCGLRWERDAPDLPLLPSARAYPAAQALRAEAGRHLSAQQEARRWADAGGPALARELVAVHAQVAAALEARLDAVGEARATASATTPATTPAPTAAASGAEASAASGARDAATGSPRAATGSPGAAAGSPSTAAAGRGEEARRALLRAERDAADGGPDVHLASLPPVDRVMLGSAYVTRAHAARLLRAPALPAPSHPAVGDAAHAVALLATVRPITYGMEVATARLVVADAPLAATARQALAAVHRQRQMLSEQAGPSAPAAPLGYDLDGPVDTPARAQALATRLLTALADAHVRALGDVTPDDGDSAAARAAATGATRDATPGAIPGASAVPDGPELAVASLLGWAREAEWWRGACGGEPRALPTA